MPDLIVKTGVKNVFDDRSVSADFYEALDEKVGELLEEPARRADTERPEKGAVPRPVTG